MTMHAVPVVFDMAHASLSRSEYSTGRPEATEPTELLVTHDAQARLVAALDAASARGEFIVQADHAPFSVTYRARVSSASVSTPTHRQIRGFDVTIKPDNGRGEETRLVVQLGRETLPGRSSAWLNVQGNSTTLLTGQNTWPLNHDFRSDFQGRIAVVCWPFWVVLAICKSIDHNFKCPKSTLKSLMKGQVVFQNVQPATYLPIDRISTTVALDLIAAHFRAMAFRTDGTTMRSFEIGVSLGITCVRYPIRSSVGKEDVTGILLQKWRGKNQFASLSLYDKAKQRHIAPNDPDFARLARMLRLDITLRQESMIALFGEVAKRASRRGQVIEFDCNASGKRICSAANIVRAIDFMDAHYRVRVPGERYRGFRAWLLHRVVGEWFHFRELFRYSERRWRKVETWISKWEQKDPRYKVAFDFWKSAEYGPLTDLRECFKRAKLSPDVSEKRLRELRRLGFSGRIPHSYFVNLADASLAWGATYEESDEFHTRLQKKENVSDLLEVRQARMARQLRRLSRAISSMHALTDIPTAPLIGQRIDDAGVVLKDTSARNKKLRSAR